MKNTTFLIFIASAIRQYDFPRVPGFNHTSDFKDLPDHDGKPLGDRYVYLGRELTVDEFNDAAAKIFAPGFPGEDRTFCPLAIDFDASEKREKAKVEAAKIAAAATAAAAKAEQERLEKEEADRIAALDAQRAEQEREEAERLAARDSRAAVARATEERDRKAAAEAKANAGVPTAPPMARPGKAKPAPVIVPDPEKPADSAEGENTQQSEDAADFEAQKAAEEEFARSKEAEEKAADEKEKSESAGGYSLNGKNIMFDGVRVAGLFAPDNSLRIPSKNASHRAAIEAWLKTQTIA